MDRVLLRSAEPLVLEPELTRDCRAKDELVGGECLNVLFTRRAEKN